MVRIGIGWERLDFWGVVDTPDSWAERMDVGLGGVGGGGDGGGGSRGGGQAGGGMVVGGGGW